jgi:signal transduction histidine kinase
MQLISDMGRSGAFLLQGLVALLMAVSVSAVWYAFRRRPMGYWAATWWVLTAAVVMSALASTDGRSGKLLYSMIGLGLWLALAPMAVGAAGAVIGRPPSPKQFLLSGLLVGGGGVAFAWFIVMGLMRWVPLDRMALGSVVATHGPVIVALLIAGARILRMAARQPRVAGLRIIGVAVVLLAARTTLWVTPGAIGATAEAREQLVAAASLLQLVTIVVLGIGTLLALLGEERQAALAREQRLSRAERMDSLGQMAGGIAHDFNNVLTAIIAGVELARQESGGNPRVAEDLEHALGAADRGRSLVSGLLRYARRESSSPVVVDLGTLVGDLRRMLGYLVGPRFDLVYRAPAEACQVRVDVPRYEQAMINLVVNARDAMPGGGRITIAVAPERLAVQGNVGTTTLPAGRYVVSSVEDTGSGIAPDDLTKIFDPFYTDKPEGTGLGLVNVQAAARDGGGAVKVESEIDRGTRFELWLPAVAPPATVATA